MFDFIWLPLKKILLWIGLISHPKGFGQWFQMEVSIKPGYAKRSKISKVFRKAAYELGADTHWIDSCIDDILNGNNISTEDFSKLYNRSYKDWIIKQAIPGLDGMRFKSILENSGCGFEVECNDITDHYIDRVACEDHLRNLKSLQQDAMTAQDFEKATELKKQIDELLEARHMRNLFGS